MSDQTLFLRLDAPFAAYRWLQAGVFRGTFPVIPHSAAWGLVLNLAGIETRGALHEVVTPIRPDAPRFDVAVGIVRAGERSTLYQQLHAYPVGNSGKELQAKTKGAKYWIAPAKREVLVGAVFAVGVRAPGGLVDRIQQGLRGVFPRYGLPFAGDNQFLFNSIDVVAAGEARWFVPVGSGTAPQESTRLTVNIDRADSSRTSAPLFAPATWGVCPTQAWCPVGPQQ
jgi:CRISPR-associated protein Cas5t